MNSVLTEFFGVNSDPISTLNSDLGITDYRMLCSKIHTLIVSFFTSVYIAKWKAFFPEKELRYAPSLRSRVICCASVEVLQAYLVWRQFECHLNNQYDICLWHLIKSGKPEKEAEEMLKGSHKQVKNELLYQCFNINYKKDIPEIFLQGTCALKTEVEDIVKYKDDGCPVKRPRRKCKLLVVHPERFSEVHEFEKPNDAQALNLMNSCATGVLEEFKDIIFAYGVSDEYSFVLKKESQLYGRQARAEKFTTAGDTCRPSIAPGAERPDIRTPSPETAPRALTHHLSLRRVTSTCHRCSVAVVPVPPGSPPPLSVRTTFSQWALRFIHLNEIVSAVVSFFSSLYTMKWNEFFPHKELKYPPYFDGRAVCYPSCEILLDYLAWRQVDCHINNQYNTCFWMLVKSGKSKSEAQNYLKGTQTQEKNELLDQLSGIINYYNTLPPMFRQGSSVYWDRVSLSTLSLETKIVDNGEGSAGKSRKIVVVKHCNIIETSFWEAHSDILNEKRNGFTFLSCSTSG
ncbi:hypothetical protein DH2020_015468 [Rehmannia glutinosa]|uniref:tRNA(His) guanylyltransferase n=1 Tax=Rehmannia glutinosa TaxID=99300 RepID=A0ABR0WUB0_REHGL